MTTPTAASSAILSPLRSELGARISTLRLSLPTLKDSETWRTHTSYRGAAHDAFERPQGEKVWDYERQEHVGDAVLEYHVTRLIDRKYPRLTVGSRTLLRSLLVSNSLLSALSSHLGLPQQLLAAEAQLPRLQTNYRVQAAIFEAYMGALDLEQPRSTVEQLVEEMFGELAEMGYEGLKKVFVDPSSISPQAEVRRCLGEAEGDQLGEGVGKLKLAPTSLPVANHVGKMMEWAAASGHAHQRSVTFRKLSPTLSLASDRSSDLSSSPLSTTAPTGNGPQVTTSAYELEWQDLGAIGEGADELRRGMKVRGEGRTVKVAKAVAAHQACSVLGI